MLLKYMMKVIKENLVILKTHNSINDNFNKFLLF